MFRRALLRQSQAVKPALSARPPSAVSVSRTFITPLQTHPILKPWTPRVWQRYSSTETEGEKKEQKEGEEKKEQNEEAAPKEGENKTEDPTEALKKELEAKKQEVIDLKDKYLRSLADFHNLQERTRREVESARLFGIQKFAQDLVETVDNFERALLAVPEEKLKPTESEQNKDIIDLYEGLKMTERIFMNTLKKHGLERFDPSELVDGKPQKFDPKFHEATFMAPAPDKQDGDVMYTQTKGFILNGRVLRAAKVGVVKNA
ncbi:hypothetical protein VTO42DRAFT_6690 [Malbranchea cinnamomea]